MPDEAATTTSSETTETEATDAATATVDHAAEAEKYKSIARSQERKYKDTVKELDALKTSQMTEQEKAVAQATDAAKAEGRKEAITGMGAKLVSAEIRAVAAGRLDDAQLAALLEGLNPASFLTEDGDVDAAKVQKFVDGIAPAKDAAAEASWVRKPEDIGQGATGTSVTKNDPLLKEVMKKIG